MTASYDRIPARVPQDDDALRAHIAAALGREVAAGERLTDDEGDAARNAGRTAGDVPFGAPALAPPADPDDPFAGAEPIAGLEQLGRAITDAEGIPSGSPANFEALRGARYPLGRTPPPRAAADINALISAIGTEFPDLGTEAAADADDTR